MKLINRFLARVRSYCVSVLFIRPPTFGQQDATDREVGFFFYGLAVGVLLCILIFAARI